jgi:hypothetical protein
MRSRYSFVIVDARTAFAECRCWADIPVDHVPMVGERLGLDLDRVGLDPLVEILAVTLLTCDSSVS